MCLPLEKIIVDSFYISNDERATIYEKHLEINGNKQIRIGNLRWIKTLGKNFFDPNFDPSFGLHQDGVELRISNEQIKSILGNVILIHDESSNEYKWIKIKNILEFNSTAILRFSGETEATKHQTKIYKSLLKIAFSVNPNVQRRPMCVAIRAAQFESEMTENPFHNEYLKFIENNSETDL